MFLFILFLLNSKMLNKSNIKLMKELRANSRVKLTKLSRRTQIPVSTIFDRLKVYKKDFIKKFTCLLKFPKLGYESHSFVVFAIPKIKRNELKEFLENCENVNSLYRINHKYDFLVEFVFKNIRELENLCDRIDDLFAIRPKYIFYVVDTISKEAFLSGKESQGFLTEIN